MEYYIFGFVDVKGHSVTLKPDCHFLNSMLTLAISACKSESESSPVVSSAYKTENRSVALGRLLIKQRKRMGPREVPCCIFIPHALSIASMLFNDRRVRKRSSLKPWTGLLSIVVSK
jgi:hypothetical protein